MEEQQQESPDYSGQPLKSIIVENIKAIELGKELTVPLSYLNKFCEFRTVYRRIFGEFEKQDKEEIKAKRRVYMRAYYQRPEIKAKMRAYYLRKKGEKK